MSEGMKQSFEEQAKEILKVIGSGLIGELPPDDDAEIAHVLAAITRLHEEEVARLKELNRLDKDLETENHLLSAQVAELQAWKDHCFVAVKDCHNDDCDYHGLPSVIPYVQCLNAITVLKKQIAELTEERDSYIAKSVEATEHLRLSRLIVDELTEEGKRMREALDIIRTLTFSNQIDYEGHSHEVPHETLLQIIRQRVDQYVAALHPTTKEKQGQPDTRGSIE